MSHYNYIMTFHYSVNEGDMISVVQTNLDIAITRLNNDFDSHIAKYDPTLSTKLTQKNLNRRTTQIEQKPVSFTLEHQTLEKVKKRTSERGQREGDTLISIEETKDPPHKRGHKSEVISKN